MNAPSAETQPRGWPAEAARVDVAVAYSRVHTGVHYPGDVAIGSLIGGALPQVTTRAVDRWPRGPFRPRNP